MTAIDTNVLIDFHREESSKHREGERQTESCNSSSDGRFPVK